MLDFAKLLLYRSLLQKVSWSELQKTEALELPFGSLSARLELSAYLNGFEPWPVLTKQDASRYYRFEAVLGSATTCCFLEGNKVVWHRVDSSCTEIALDVEPTLELRKKLEAAFLVRWGGYYQEVIGEGFVVVEDGGEYFTNLRGCSCLEYRDRGDCCHLSFAQVLQENRERFKFLGV